MKQTKRREIRISNVIDNLTPSTVALCWIQVNHSQKINKNWKAIYTRESAVVHSQARQWEPCGSIMRSRLQNQTWFVSCDGLKDLFPRARDKMNVEHLSIISIVWQPLANVCRQLNPYISLRICQLIVTDKEPFERIKPPFN